MNVIKFSVIYDDRYLNRTSILRRNVHHSIRDILYLLDYFVPARVGNVKARRIGVPTAVKNNDV